MPNPVLLSSSAICSPLGDLSHTVQALMEGICAVGERPCHGVDVPWAPMHDPSLRDLATCAATLGEQARVADSIEGRLLFVYCAAKGDLRSLDLQSAGMDPGGVPSPLLETQAAIVADALGIRPDRTMVISNACASGAIALEAALDLLRAEAFDSAVLIGFDTVSRFVASGFFALGAVSPDTARPFDARRNGLSLGEGAAVAVLTRNDPSDGAIEVAGAGSSNDANHRTGPSRDGDGLYRAAAMALRNAGLAPGDIGGVKCHGTATLYNDAMEAKALTTLFGSDYPPCVSLKGAIGHTSGGGSLLEAIVGAECLKLGSLPPTVGYAEHGVDEPVPVSAQTQELRSPALLCLSAGFGGVNAAAVLRKAVA